MLHFDNLTVTQILREIKFGNFGCSKIAILVILEALNFDFCRKIPHLKTPKGQNDSFLDHKIAQFDFTEIPSSSKFLRFSHCKIVSQKFL